MTSCPCGRRGLGTARGPASLSPTSAVISEEEAKPAYFPMTAFLAKLTYKSATPFGIRRRCGSSRPKWCSRIVCTLSGRTTRRGRTVRPSLVGKTTSVLWIRELLQERGYAPAQAGTLRPAFQRLAEHVRQKAHQNVGLDSLRRLMPHRSQAQLVFLDPERSLRFRQLHGRLPKILGRPVRDIASQEIAALTTLRRLQAPTVSVTRSPQRTRFVTTDLDREEPRRRCSCPAVGRSDAQSHPDRNVSVRIFAQLLVDLFRCVARTVRTSPVLSLRLPANTSEPSGKPSRLTTNPMQTCLQSDR